MGIRPQIYGRIVEFWIIGFIDNSRLLSAGMVVKKISNCSRKRLRVLSFLCGLLNLGTGIIKKIGLWWLDL